MKKLLKLMIILTIFIVILMGIKVYAVTPTLDQIVNIFNNCLTVKEYATYGSVWNATSDGTKLTISVTTDNTITNLEYTLEGSILSANFSGDDAFTGVIVSVVLADSIGQLHGYSDGELFTTLNSDKVLDYTVENEGFEIKETVDKKYQIQIDISKKIPLMDVANLYIEVSDLQDLKSYISGNGSAEKSKGNIWFNKSGYDGENTLLVAEKYDLTDNTYKSILSIIEVMFDSNNASDYFKSNYSGISIGNKEFSGFKVEINPIKTESEEYLIPKDSEYQFVRITIDKDLVNSAINGTNQNPGNDEENNDNQNNQIQQPINDNNEDNTIVQASELPETGYTSIIFIMILSFSIIMIILVIKLRNFKDIR